TQCFTDRNLDKVCKASFSSNLKFGSDQGRNGRNSSSILTNLILKMNAKLGGTNCVINEDANNITALKGKLMVIGADVTHPSKTDNFQHSVCSVVGSWDDNYCKFINTS